MIGKLVGAKLVVAGVLSLAAVSQAFVLARRETSGGE